MLLPKKLQPVYCCKNKTNYSKAMDLFDLFFGAGPAVTVIFKLGFIPKEDEFYELTYQQYQHYLEVYGQKEEKSQV